VFENHPRACVPHSTFYEDPSAQHFGQKAEFCFDNTSGTDWETPKPNPDRQFLMEAKQAGRDA
jgi:hypothetical protein